MQLLLPDRRALSAADLLDLYDPGQVSCLRVGFVLTTDGGIAHDGTSRSLQSPADVAVFHALRAVADAVVVGAGTARSEDYGPVRPRPEGQAWREAHGLAPQPPLVIVSRALDLDPAARCFSGPCVVVTCAAAKGQDRFPDVIVAGEEQVDLAAAVQQLTARGLGRLLCEGGPRLLTALIEAGLVDELCLTHAPLLLGPAPTLLSAPQDPPLALELRHLVDGGGGVLLGRYGLRPALRPA